MEINIDAALQLALAHYQQGKFDEAKLLCEQVIQAQANHAPALHFLGVLANQRKAYREGIEWISQALRYEERPNFYFNRGCIWQTLKEFSLAIADYDRVIELKADHADAYANRGFSKNTLGDYSGAVADYHQAIALSPHEENFYNNRGLALLNLGEIESAKADFSKSMALNPKFSDTYVNLGNAFLLQNKPQEACMYYDQAIQLKPETEGAYWNKSLALLLQGNFREGWQLYEWRLKQDPEPFPSYHAQPWRGEPALQGKTIVLYTEQGLGDVLQFCRYATVLAELHPQARVVLTVGEDFCKLMQSIHGIEVVAHNQPLPPFDYHCPLMSLPLVCKTFSEQAIPATMPYLFAPPDKIAHWQARLAQMSAQHQKPKRRVGLIWSGGFRPDMPEVWGLNARRNLPFEQIAVLQDLPCDFYSLQKGEPAESELPAQKAQHWHTDNLYLANQELHDFSDTAALIMNLDLVIAVDTSSAHLAGALGKPVWLLSRFDGCWRWLLERADTPWYPSMKIYRQPQARDWASVLKQVKADLAAWL